MSDILVVYHDPIPKYRSRFLGDDTKTTIQITNGTDTYTCVCVPNWHCPVSFQRRIKTIADFKDNDIVVNTEAFDAFTPFNYDAYIFVAPLDTATSTDRIDFNYAKCILSSSSNVNTSAYYTVVPFEMFGQEHLPYVEIEAQRHMVFDAKNEPAFPMLAVRQAFERYLGYRMSDDLSKFLDCRVGITPGQMSVIKHLCLAHNGDDIELGTTYTTSTATVLSVETKFDFGSSRTIEQAIPHIAKTLDGISSISKLDSVTINLDGVIAEQALPYTLFAKHFPEHKAAYYERCIALAATGMTTNPAGAVTSKLVEKHIGATLKLYPMSRAVGTEVYGVWADCSVGASSLLEYNDRLVDMFVDLHDKTLASLLTCNIEVVCGIHRDDVSVTRGIFVAKSKLAGTHFQYQNEIKFNILVNNSSDTIDTHHTFKATDTPRVVPIATSQLTSDISRLLSKRYVALSQGGGLYLTDFGAVVYYYANKAYSKVIKSLTDKVFGEFTDARLANKRLAALFVGVEPRKLQPKHLVVNSKTKGKQREFKLVTKNSKRGKFVYWKSKTIVRGVRARLIEGKLKLTVLKNVKGSKQSEKRLDTFIPCVCGEVRAEWNFDTKAKASHFVCANCGYKHQHYNHLK